MITCQTCKGHGYVWEDIGECPDCKGTGTMEPPSEICRRCKGTGFFLTSKGLKVRCRTCKGTGNFKIREWLESQGRLDEFIPRKCKNRRCHHGRLTRSKECPVCHNAFIKPMGTLGDYMPEGIEAVVTELRA